MATADQVVVELRADVDRYIANTNKAASNFDSKIRQMETAAVGAGRKIDRGLGQITQGAPRATREMRNLGYQTGNVAAQFQDMGVQLASGTSPFIIMAQQIPQITAATGSLGGALGGLRMAFTSLISPVGLMSAAFILVTSAVVNYFSTVDSELPDADEIIKRHDDVIRALREAWNLPKEAAEEYGDAAQKALTAGAAEDQLKSLKSIVEDAADALEGELARNIDFVRSTLEDAEPVVGKLQTALDRLVESGDVRQFATDMRAIEIDPNVEKDVAELAGTMRRAAAEGADAQQKYEELNGTLIKTEQSTQAAIQAFSTLTLGLVGMGKEGVTAIDAISDKFRTGLLPMIQDAIEKIGGMFEAYKNLQDQYAERWPLPDEAPIPNRLGVDDFYGDGSGMRSGDAQSFLKSRAVSDRIAGRIDALDKDFAENLAKVLAQFPELRVVSARRTYAEQKAIYDSGVRPAARPGHSLHESGRAADLGFKNGGEPSREFLNRLYAAAREAGIEFPVRGDPFHAQPMGVSGRGSQFAAPAGVGGAQKKSPAEIFQGDMDQVQQRIDMMNAMLEAQKGLTTGVEDYGFAVEQARIKQELLNEASRAGLTITPELAAKIDQLATNYAKAASSADQLAAQQQETAAAASEFASFAKDILGGFISDLREGKSASEALANALNKVADKLIDMALNALFSGFGGGGGGGIFGALFGGFKAGGGPVQSGKAYVVGEKRPELFVPSSAGRIIPNVPAAGSYGRNGTMGTDVTARVYVDQDGNWQAAVERISQKEVRRASPAIVAAGQKQTRKNLPGMFSDMQTREL